MKYIIILGDGMPDYPLDELGVNPWNMPELPILTCWPAAGKWAWQKMFLMNCCREAMWRILP